MKNLLLRTLFGALYVGVVIASILLGKYYFGAVFFLFTFLSIREFIILNGGKDTRSLLSNACVAGVALFVIAWLYAFMPEALTLQYVLAYAFFLFVSMAMVLRQPVSQSMSFWGSLLTSQVLVALPFAALCLILAKDWRYAMILFVTLWVNDTFAYITGSLTAKLPAGNHKMTPSISPLKSWEGLAGGIVFSLVAGWVFYAVHWLPDLMQALLLTGIIAVSGVVGDLMESMLKRSVGVKDSGKFLPGHGGVLDRFDSLLFAAPMYLIFLYLMQL